MPDRRNASGRPLAGSVWLDAHHRAKRAERRAFARRLAELRPRLIVDLGCATGLWLEELDAVMPPGCAFCGIDADGAALDQAERRAAGWSRTVDLIEADIEAEPDRIPGCDLVLLFNLSSYIADLDRLLALLADQARTVAVRQYDGAALRFGPMSTADRAIIEDALLAGVAASAQFRHYDLDRVFSALHGAPYSMRDIQFELFARASPFPADFIDYFEGTLDWTLEHVSDLARERLQAWRTRLDDPGFPPTSSRSISPPCCRDRGWQLAKGARTGR